MLSRYEYPTGIWVDLEQPTEEEIRAVSTEFNISSRIELELLSPTPAPLVAGATDMALLVLHFPAHGESEGGLKDQEIDFIVAPHFIVTVRYEVVAPLHHLKKLLETEQSLAEGSTLSSDVLLEILFAHLYGSVRDHAQHSSAALANAEHQMFQNRERETVHAISSISREFLHLEAALANQEEPLGRFLKVLTTRNFFGPSFGERAARILAERTQMAHLIRTYRAVTTELRETNKSLLETRQNDIIKTLTVVNAIFLPLGLISWTFAMRTEGMPLISSPHAFWIVIGIMLGVAFLLTIFFARKRWIF